MNNNGYYKKDVYEQEIKDVVKKLLLLCDQHHMPVFLTIPVANTDTGTEYVTEMQSALSAGANLKNDMLVKHALVVNGFEVVPMVQRPVYEENLEVLSDD